MVFLNFRAVDDLNDIDFDGSRLEVSRVQYNSGNLIGHHVRPTCILVGHDERT